MQLFNLRFGLATNSSSSHSLVFMSGATDRDTYGGFGWDNFMLASREAKSRYVAVILREALLSKGMTDDAAAAIVNGWVGVETDDSDYIDHQSVISLPSEYGTKIVDKQFFDEFKAFMLRDDLVILGGNDNQDNDWKPDNDFTLPLETESGHASFVCRKDHDYWTIFCQDSGTKIRFSFSDLTAVPTKAFAPELVDIKITDYCPYGCTYCYQGSTESGKHADTSYVHSLLDGLAQLKVFEIAIGGGEPTLHPDFITILRTARENGIVPNFTTRNLAWIKDAEQRIPILEHAGNFAVSVDSAQQIAKLGAALVEHKVDYWRVNIHIVMGTVDAGAFADMLKEAKANKLRVTLLGYKTNNRGAEYKAQDYSWWLTSVKELIASHECPTLSIDTVLAAEYDQALQDAGIPKWMYHVKDGGFSAYVDAVSRKMGQSSYGDESQMVDLPDGYEMYNSIRVAFSQF